MNKSTNQHLKQTFPFLNKKINTKWFISKNFVYLQPQKSQHEDEGKKRRIQD